MITGSNINRVIAIDFAPDGQLYGIGSVGNRWFLAKINCENAEATSLLPQALPADDTHEISDISFNREGQLWAYYKRPSSEGGDMVERANNAYFSLERGFPKG